MRQLELRLRLPSEMQVAWLLSRSMLCERLHLRMSREDCAARQTGEQERSISGRVRPSAKRLDPYCSSGQCKQGIAVLLLLGHAKRARCPACVGCGWVPTRR